MLTPRGYDAPPQPKVPSNSTTTSSTGGANIGNIPSMSGNMMGGGMGSRNLGSQQPLQPKPPSALPLQPHIHSSR